MPRKPPFTPVADPDAELLAQVRLRYEAGELSLDGAATALGLTRSTLTRRIRAQWLWHVPPRLRASRKPVPVASRKPRSAEAAARTGPALSRQEMSPKVLHRRLLAQIARLMRAIEANIDESGLPIDAERHGKLLSIVMKQQADAARLEDQAAAAKRERRNNASDAASAEGASCDLARLRDDLARRLAGDAQPEPPASGSGEL